MNVHQLNSKIEPQNLRGELLGYFTSLIMVAIFIITMGSIG
jgi:hypothetical protein